ncbi:MAG: alpha/beta hydrolase [Anaerolineae bacterium]
MVRFCWERLCGRRMQLPAGFREVYWQSKVLKKGMAFALYLPASYAQQQAKRYPVLYLLHGSGHNRHSVLREVQPQQCVSELGEALLVIPDGDQGWWLDSPILPSSCYGRYVLELVGFVDQHYRTLASREGRGVCGFSMGGYGAMLLASQYPEWFGAASSLLGPLDIAQLFPEHYRLGQLLGSDLAVWQQYNPTQKAANLTGTALRFCTAEEAFDRPLNDAFAAALQSLGIPFEYYVYTGAHDTAFVREHLDEHFYFHRSLFDRDMKGIG